MNDTWPFSTKFTEKQHNLDTSATGSHDQAKEYTDLLRNVGDVQRCVENIYR